MAKVGGTLPAHFDSVISTWENLDQDRQTLVGLTQRLVSAETKTAFREQTEEPSAALHAMNGSRHTPRKNKQDFVPRILPAREGEVQSSARKFETSRQHTFRCNYCGGRNHNETKCWKRKAALYDDEHHDQANVAIDDLHNSDSDDSDFSGPGVDYGYSCTSSNQSPSNSNVWLSDSGASEHMTDDRSLFDSLKPMGSTWSVNGIGKDADPFQVHGVGNVDVRAKDGRTKVITIVLFVPGLGLNLFSISAAAKRGLKCTFTENQVEIFHDDDLVVEGKKGSSKLYYITFEHVISTPTSYAKLTQSFNNMLIWRLAHTNPKNIKNMVRKSVVNGLDLVEAEKEFVCEDCTFGNQTRLPFQTDRVRATKLGELIHSDVCGPRGSRYFVTFIDDFS